MTANQATDEQLLRKFVLGDRACLGELARRYESRLLGLSSGLLGGRSDLACDAVQEAWMRVIRFGKSFNGQSSFKTWLYRITINQCRTMSSSPREQHAEDESDTPELITYESDVIADRERLTTLHDAVQRLSDPKRTVVLLCYHADMTHEQAAEILNVPLGTLKSRLHAALQELRSMLTKEHVP